MSGHTPGQWRIYVQEIADKEQAKKELCDLVEGTPNFQPRLVYVTDDDWNLAVCVTGCGERPEANARLISAAPDFFHVATTGALLNLPDLMDWIAARLIRFGDDPNVDFIFTLRERAKLLRAAIAKAEGRPE